MGQTLTHGVYLPDEGERNCYSGLAANWQLLDNSVGTIAEHTTALAGKAPAVHTHTKSDVTDLFNSANTWSANNTYSADCIIYNSDNSGSVAGLKLRNSKAEVLSTGNTSSDQTLTFRDKNDYALAYIRGAVQSTGVALKIGAYAKDSSNNTVNTELQLLAFSNGNKAIFPSTTNEYDLGSSSYQWNNVYAKGYYYNGVAWGLDKNNTWSNANKYTSGFILSNISWSGVTPPSSAKATVIEFKNSDTRQGRYINRIGVASAETWIETIRNVDANTSHNFTVIFQVDNSGNKKLLPYNSNADLGQSTSNSTGKWKTLNGVNPGALSLPRTASSTLDTTNWNLRGGLICSFTPSYDGFINVQIKRDVDFSVWAISDGRQNFRSSLMPDGYYAVMVWFPCRAGFAFQIYSVPLIDSPAEQREADLVIQVARIWPCEGNV